MASTVINSNGEIYHPSGWEEFWQDPGRGLGRFWNDVSGTSAQMDRNSEEAAADRLFQHDEAELAWNRNQAGVREQREWDLMLSNTAHQRAVADMKSAGINPMLAAGSAASTPSGTAAQAAGMPSGSRAASAQTGSGGVVGLIARAAASAIALGVASKFKNTASMAAQHGSSVSKAVEREMKSEFLMHGVNGGQKGLSAGKSASEAMREARRELEQYFAGKRAHDEAELLRRYGPK